MGTYGTPFFKTITTKLCWSKGHVGTDWFWCRLWNIDDTWSWTTDFAWPWFGGGEWIWWCHIWSWWWDDWWIAWWAASWTVQTRATKTVNSANDIPQPAQGIEAGEAIEAVPEILFEGPAGSVTVHDDLLVTPTSPIKQPRDACRWLNISQPGSKQRMFSRIQRARELAIKRSMVEAAQEQFRQNMHEVKAVPIPP